MNKRFALFIMILLIFSCQEENRPPVCIIVSPTNNSAFNLGETISVELLVSDPEGELEDITIQLNGTIVTTLTGASNSYDLTTSSYQPGNFVLSATARDKGGLEDSDQIQILLNAATPRVITVAASSVTDSSAVILGNVAETGGSVVTARGMCWGTLENPTLSNNHTTEGSGVGSFSSTITSLLCSTLYYVRAYATNELGTSYGDQVSFTTGSCYVLPVVNTLEITGITNISATCRGEITDDGGANIRDRGICWSTMQNPTASDFHSSDGTGTGIFSSSLTGLDPLTVYYARAYATNAQGTGYGNELSFQTLWDSTYKVTDFDGNIYKTIQIGNQVWMAENLNATHYSDGTQVPLVESDSGWIALGGHLRGYCWYDNNSLNGDTYGALYTWPAAMNGANSSNSNPSGAQGVCPDGWHLPSDGEWKELEIYLGMSQSEANSNYWRGTDEGGKLKVSDTIFWNSPNIGATNESGFTALAAGNRSEWATFGSLGVTALFWTSTELDGSHAWSRFLNHERNDVYREFDNYKIGGYSVRCVRDP